MESNLKQKLINCLRKYFKENLVSVVLFGSRVRGDARPDSDYDLFLVAFDLLARFLERRSYIRKAVSLKFDQKISVYAKTKKEFESGFPPLYLDLGVDGQILYDTNDY